ncbi:MAG TPA: formate dehydrogenase accessory sulfurtransferase FdhD [Bacteroidia bacterium]|nr:formate dehydrogenase accessory sulfurtransferase FdhD [Bacteroidia bacterium]HNT81073.1 formate dehydrogenase accessory sulfurtransferase FdhD [Bacteroidia bacterium]
MPVKKYKATKFQSNSYSEVNDTLSVEALLNISINQVPFSITMRSPGNEFELIRGLLFSEGIVTQSDAKLSYNIVSKNSDGIIDTIDVQIDTAFLDREFSGDRNLASVSSCGLCGKTELIESEFKTMKDTLYRVSSNQINEMFIEMSKHQLDFSQSGGVHAAAAFDHQANLMIAMEDIGRHNAVDKVVGHLIDHTLLSKAKALLVSGRISYEISSKAAQAGFEVLASVSAPSSLAVDYCHEHGITLLAFCREHKHTVYSHSFRLEN